MAINRLFTVEIGVQPRPWLTTPTNSHCYLLTPVPHPGLKPGATHNEPLRGSFSAASFLKYFIKWLGEHRQFLISTPSLLRDLRVFNLRDLREIFWFPQITQKSADRVPLG